MERAITHRGNVIRQNVMIRQDNPDAGAKAPQRAEDPWMSEDVLSKALESPPQRCTHPLTGLIAVAAPRRNIVLRELLSAANCLLTNIGRPTQYARST